MLHILLTIIKIPFILLAVILLLLLLVLLLVSFVPLRYKAAVQKGEGLYASGTVTWLLHFISIRFEYADKQTGLQVKLAGFPLIGKKAKKKRQKKLPEEEEAAEDTEFPKTDSEILQEPEIVKEPEDASEEPEVPEDGEEDSEEPEILEDGEEASEEPEVLEDGEETSQMPEISEDEENAHSGRDTEDEEGRPERSEPIFRKIIGKLKDIIQKLRDIFGSLSKTAADIKAKLDAYKRLWYDEHTQNAWRRLKKEGFCLLRHYRPRKANGKLRFGFEDPALTGELLGALCILQALSGNNLIAEADFEQKIFEGEFTLKGHIRVCHFLRAALALVFDKHCRITFKRIRKLL